MSSDSVGSFESLFKIMQEEDDRLHLHTTKPTENQETSIIISLWLLSTIVEATDSTRLGFMLEEDIVKSVMTRLCDLIRRFEWENPGQPQGNENLNFNKKASSQREMMKFQNPQMLGLIIESCTKLSFCFHAFLREKQQEKLALDIKGRNYVFASDELLEVTKYILERFKTFELGESDTSRTEINHLRPCVDVLLLSVIDLTKINSNDEIADLIKLSELQAIMRFIENGTEEKSVTSVLMEKIKSQIQVSC